MPLVNLINFDQMLYIKTSSFFVQSEPAGTKKRKQTLDESTNKSSTCIHTSLELNTPGSKNSRKKKP